MKYCLINLNPNVSMIAIKHLGPVYTGHLMIFSDRIAINWFHLDLATEMYLCKQI